MNKIKTAILPLLACLSFGIKIKAQKVWQEDLSYFDNIRHKEFMVNVTPLISQFVPFNASNISRLGIYDFQYRKLRNGKGLRWGLGVNVSDITNVNSGSSDPQFIALRFGWIKRKQISKHIHFTRAFDINIGAEDAFGSNRKLNFNGFAPSLSVGFEYAFNETIAISTEGSLLIGLLNVDGEAPIIRFSPPISLMFHVRF
jgi:hypothetical protein